MTILVLGGRGKTSIRLASVLNDAEVPFILASRSTSDAVPYKQAKFDWFDEKTYNNPFELADSTNDPITAVYLVAPDAFGMVPSVKAFIDYARNRGVKRFVLLSASVLEAGGPMLGQVHEYLASLDVEYMVLRPTWFMENFSELEHRNTIQKEDKIYSATSQGKIPFISAEDIARVAYYGLTDEKAHNTDYLILGPELMTYDQVAEILSETLGRKITHINLSEEDKAKQYKTLGLSEDYAAMLAHLDTEAGRGGEERLSDAVEKVTGKKPLSFQDFANKNREAWTKA